MNKFYVYAYVRANGVPFYIGKGQGRRINQKHHGFRIPKDKSRRVMLIENLSEADAFMHEKRLIAEYGRKANGGVLYNKTDGGDGTSGRLCTDATRAKISAARQRQDMSSHMKPQTYNGVTFPSLRALRAHYGIPKATYYKRVREGRCPVTGA